MESSLCLLSASIGSCLATADCRGREFGRAVQRLASTSVLYGQLSKPARVLWFLTPSWCKGERWSCSHFSSTWRLPRDAGFRHQLRCASRFRMVKLFDYICTKIPPP